MPSTLRLAARSLARRPGTVILGVLALGLGIGLSTTFFSALRGVFLRPLPFVEADRLVQIDVSQRAAGIARRPPPVEDVLLWQEEARSLAGLAAWQGVGMTLSGGEAPADRRNGAWVTHDLFPLLGVRPALGRGPLPEDTLPGAPKVVVVSDEVWRAFLGGERAAVGRSLRLHGEPATVIGVMPAGFHFPLSQDFWLPLSLEALRGRPSWGVQVVARLAGGVSVKAAQAELDGLLARGSGAPEGFAATVRPYVKGYTDPELRRTLWALMVAVIGVLLVACANVGTLLLARGLSRGGELALLEALGAGRRRLLASSLAEAALVAGAGGLLGVAVAALGTTLLDRWLAPLLRSFWVDIRLDLPALAFALGASVAACLAAGLLPAWRLSRSQPATLLKTQAHGTTAPGRGRVESWLVAGQLALSAALLLATGLVGESAWRLARVDQGFEPRGLLAAGLSLPPALYPDAAARTQAVDQLGERLAAVPGVEAVAFASSLPLERGKAESFEIEGREGVGPPLRAYRIGVTPRFFATLGVAPRAGRDFTTADGAGEEAVAILDERFLRRLGESAGSWELRLREVTASGPGAWRRVVGVAPGLGSDLTPDHVRGFLPVVSWTRESELLPTVYVPLAQAPPFWATLLVRAAGDPLALAPRLRQELGAFDPDLALVGLTTLDEEIRSWTWDYRLFGRVLALFAAVALGLVGLGLFGAASVAVAARTRELGLRAALGAQPGRLRRAVLGEGLGTLALALGAGLGLGVGLAWALGTLLFAVEPWEPRVLGVVVAVLAGSVLLARLAPARRAARVDPAAVLREG